MEQENETMTDNQLRAAVMTQLNWEPEVIATEIGVGVSEGIITLTGFVDTYAEKLAAERTVSNVRGVRGIANDIQVMASQLTDTEIAKNAAHALESNIRVPAQRLTVSIQDGLATLRGTVNWAYQKDAAAASIKDLLGIREVLNEIEIEPVASPLEVEEEIAAALGRSTLFDEHRIQIEAEDGTVTLSGHVRSMAESGEAERIAWAAAGVARVNNRLLVTP
jgi:osmotically-inducible protein OsmY